MRRLDEQIEETAADRLGDADDGQAVQSAAQMLDHANRIVKRQQAFDRPAAPGDEPFDEIDGVDGPFSIDARFLQIVEHTAFAGPDAARRRLQQGEQRLPPIGGYLVGVAECVL